MEECSASAPKKRKNAFYSEKCCFCKRPADKNEGLTLFYFSNGEHLLSVCKTRQDKISNYIIKAEESVRKGTSCLYYHKGCRSKFMHPFYLDNDKNTEVERHVPEQFTRSKTYEFDWKNKCFICGKTCHLKKRLSWSVVETAIDKRCKLYTQVLNAAELRNDREVLSRLLSTNGDLVAVEARYHRQKGCWLGSYISERNLSFSNSTPEKTSHKRVCESLKHELTETIIEHKCVYELCMLKGRFIEIAKETNIPINSKLKTSNFKNLLINVWPELRFISRKGLTDLVCSNKLSVDEAVARVAQVEAQMNETNELENYFLDGSDTANSNDDASILHKAAVILRSRVLNASKIIDKEYYSADEISRKCQKDYLDPVLLRFVIWLSSQKKIDDGHDIEDDIDQKVVAVASDITALVAPKCITPKHLGLSIHLHHTFGSKKLIEELSVLGHTLSYTEVRHFLTSAAVHMSSSQERTASGGLVPANVNSDEDNGTLLVAAADNWDHNEHTFSGKKSTHAMTSILVVPKSLSSDRSTRIPRVQERSVNISSLPGRCLSHVIPYMRPSERPQLVLFPPVRSDELNCPEPPSYKLIKMKQLLYNLGRSSIFCDDRNLSMPPWTVFESHIEVDKLSSPSTVVFNPIIMATPTDFSTVYTVLKRTKEQMNALGQTICPIVFDMGLLAKALEVFWANKTELEGILPLEGGMHLLMSCFAGIGFLYGNVGLKELLYESDVFAKATAEHILSGRDFDRALRAVLLTDEVLNKRFLIHFKSWLNRNGKVIPTDLSGDIAKSSTFLLQNDSPSMDKLLCRLDDTLLPLIEQFRAEGREASPLFQFWDDYLRNVSGPIKIFLASSRHGLWDVHHFSKLTLLPFFFATNRLVYAKYMTYMLLSMNRLPDKALDSFRKGNFVAKLTDGVFNSVWIDYVLEVTENKTLKSSGGIIGLTHTDTALVRWFLSRPLTAKYSMVYRSNSSDVNAERRHHTESSAYKDAFNTDVSRMNNLFVDTFIDPFSLTNAPRQLVNFATGVAVGEEAERNMLGCHKDGHVQLQKFVDERFVVQEGKVQPSKKFFDPLPKSKFKPFKTNKSSVKCKSRDVHIGGEEMYLRLLAINSFKKVPLERVMSFENAPVPLSLFNDEGIMIGNKKSDFMAKLESLIDPALIVKSLDSIDSIVFDGMAIIQMLQPVPSVIKPTYSDMASLFWNFIFSKSQDITSIHVIFDQYINNSLKAQTRAKRGEHTICRSPCHIESKMKINDWKRVLASTGSKNEITNLYTKYICDHAQDIVPCHKKVYVSGGFQEQALMIQHDLVAYIHDLDSNQEEADTRMLLHVKYSSSRGAKRVVVFSPDTDVLVLLIHHYFNLGVQELFFKTGRRCLYSDYTRFIPVHCLIESLSYEQRNILLSVYCITGCDTCSSFFGIGKKKVFKVLLDNAGNLQNLALIGNDECQLSDCRKDCLKFIGLLYGVNQCVSLNKLRVEKVIKNKATKPKKLPPTDDSFLLHLLRCTYQLFVWKGCLSAMQNLPNPLDFGYIVDSSTCLYIPQLMGQPVAAPELLSDLVCICNDLCGEECICSSNEQPCTQACECKACTDTSEVCENVFTILASTADDNNIQQ